MSRGPRELRMQATPNFNLVFVIVVILTIASLGVAVILTAFVLNQSDTVKDIVGKCTSGYQLGFGAILGLLGGKNTR